MIFPSPLVSGTLVRRYKRFLADVILDDGTEITASVPNTGSMMGLTDPGSKTWLSYSPDPKRKYAHALQIVEADNTLVGVNTSLPNKLAEEAIINGIIPQLSGYSSIKREQKYGTNSRIDLLLQEQERPDCYVEVKNVHLMRTPSLAEFPDTATVRGVKHLVELGKIAQSGMRAVMLFVIQRSDCDHFRVCGDLDPLYGKHFQLALSEGVEAFAIKCDITPEAITAQSLIPIDDVIF